MDNITNFLSRHTFSGLAAFFKSWTAGQILGKVPVALHSASFFFKFLIFFEIGTYRSSNLIRASTCPIQQHCKLTKGALTNSCRYRPRSSEICFFTRLFLSFMSFWIPSIQLIVRPILSWLALAISQIQIQPPSHPTARDQRRSRMIL